MVAKPDPIPSEKRPPLLCKEQIIEKIDENPEIQTTLETYESMIALKQNLDIPISEMMEQLVEVTEIISQNRIQQCTLEQISDTSVSQDVKELQKPSKVLSRDRPQRLFDVIVGMNQDSTDETRNTGKAKSGNQTMTEGMSIDKGELSVERECDMSVLIKQICTESDVISQCVLRLSGLRRMLECYTRLIGTLQGVDVVPPETGMSDSDHRGSHHSENVGILKQLMDESREHHS